MLDFFSTNHILIHIPLGVGGYDLSYIEAVGTIFGLLCIYLVSIEKNINYLFGVVNVILFAIIFYQINLYASLLLQIFFLLANIYGWYAWTRVDAVTQQSALKIRWMSRSKLWITLFISMLFTIVLTFTIDPVFTALTKLCVQFLNLFGAHLAIPHLTPDAFPFWDSFMTVFSIAAQIVMVRKYVENWIMWIAIDIVSVAIFILQGVYVMAIQYAILILIAINGTRVWMREAKANAISE